MMHDGSDLPFLDHRTTVVLHGHGVYGEIISSDKRVMGNSNMVELISMKYIIRILI